MADVAAQRTCRRSRPAAASSRRANPIRARRPRARARHPRVGRLDHVDLVPIDEPVELGTDAADALAFAKTMGIVEGLTDALDASARAEAMSNLADLLRARETTAGVLMGTAAWLITAHRS